MQMSLIAEGYTKDKSADFSEEQTDPKNDINNWR